MNQKNLIIFGIVIIIIVAVAFYLLGSSAGKNSAKSEVEYYKKIIDEWVPIPDEIYSIAGKITEVGNNFINTESTIKERYKLQEDWETANIKIIISDKTKIFKNDENDTELKISDLKIDDRVTINASENLKNKREFTAITVFVTNVE